MKIAICDDEIYFQKKINAYISDYLDRTGNPSEINVFGSGGELLEQGMDLRGYDIIFLDINMKEIDGIETARRIRDFAPKVFLVFVTAYIDYTLEGYKVEAFRYVLKMKEQMQAAIEESLDSIMKKMNQDTPRMRFCFREGEYEVPIEKLLYVESRLHKLMFHVFDQEERIYTLYDKLNAVEAQLKEHAFVRIHQSFLVNLRYVKDIAPYKLILVDCSELSIPRARYNDVKNRYISYKGEI